MKETKSLAVFLFSALALTLCLYYFVFEKLESDEVVAVAFSALFGVFGSWALFFAYAKIA